jgi:hypothetical protein
MKRLRAYIIFTSLILLTAEPLSAAIPPPFKFTIPFESAWTGFHEILKDNQLQIIEENRGQGYIRTGYKEYMSGSLTESHIRKIGEEKRAGDGNWVKVEYQYEIVVQLITARETIVTVNANIRALKRDFFGSEEWIDFKSTGQREEFLLTEFGRLFFGENFELYKSKKGFWEGAPRNLTDILHGTQRTASPERP